MRWVRDLLYLPDPSDKHPAPLRPAELVPGVYVLKREPRDTEIRWYDPNGSEYLLEFFEGETLMKNVLKIPEEYVNIILDRLWNFCFVAFDTHNPERAVTRPEICIKEEWNHPHFTG